MPMEIIHHKAEAYAKRYTTKLDSLLEENELETMRDHPHAQMHSGHVQGKVLEMLSLMIKPHKILEIGTFTGFSALCLCKGLEQEGVLHTIELREEDALNAALYFKKAGVEDQIRLHVGDAIDIIPGIKEEWDLVFIDADKIRYIDYYELTLPFLKKGGWIVADNVLFHGEVLKDEITGKNAKAIQDFNYHVSEDKRVAQVLLTVRDGLLIIRKL